MFKEEGCYDPNIYRTCSHLKKKIVLIIKKKFVNFKKLLEIKKQFPCNKKKFLELDEKNNLFNKENFLL